MEASARSWSPAVLQENARRCFESPSPKAKGFLLSTDEAAALIAREEADYAKVVRPYLTAADIADHPTSGPVDGLSILDSGPLRRQ